MEKLGKKRENSNREKSDEEDFFFLPTVLDGLVLQLPGVDPNDPSVRELVASFQQEEVFFSLRRIVLFCIYQLGGYGCLAKRSSDFEPYFEFEVKLSGHLSPIEREESHWPSSLK